MKPVSPELLALLATRQFYSADIYTFELANGATLNYCGGDQDLTVNGILYPAGGQIGPYFDRKDNKAKCHWKVGEAVDTLVVDVLPGSALVEGTPFLNAVREGLFDGAQVTLQKVFMPTYGDTRRGTVVYFVGRVADIDAGRSVATFSINSHLELLNLNLPRNIYQPGCVNNLGDASCTVNLSLYSTPGTITTGSSVGTLYANLVGSFPQGTFDLGTIAFTSGANNGLTTAVQRCEFGSPAEIVLNGFLPVAPSSGDTFIIYYGCDKSFATPISTTGNTDGVTNSITSLASTSGILVDMFVSGPGVPPNTYVTGVASFSVTLSNDTVSANVGDTYYFQSSNGCIKFNNLVNFRGFPFIPQPATAA